MESDVEQRKSWGSRKKENSFCVYLDINVSLSAGGKLFLLLLLPNPGTVLFFFQLTIAFLLKVEFSLLFSLLHALWVPVQTP